MSRFIEHQARIGDEWAGRRLDQALAALWPEYSRSRLADWIRAGQVRLDGEVVKPNRRLAGGEQVTLSAELVPHGDPRPQDIALDLRYADPAVYVVNKPAGLVVHPGSGNPDGTLVNALLHLDPELEVLPRAGLVHRLDKDTTGCVLVARTVNSHNRLVRAMKRREIRRRYQALARGSVIAGDTVDAPMGRHPVDRRRQTVRSDGRPARTRYRVLRRLTGATLLEVTLETGRTHQIRVHLAHAGFPVIGDPVYGVTGAPAGLSDAQRAAWLGFRRQALHAADLAFPHPDTGETVEVDAPLPEDFVALIDALAAG